MSRHLINSVQSNFLRNECEPSSDLIQALQLSLSESNFFKIQISWLIVSPLFEYSEIVHGW